MVKELDDKLFRQLIFDYSQGDNAPLLVKGNTIVEFYVTWCPHCQAMMPRYEKVSEMFPDVLCTRVEMEKYPELAKMFKVDSFPTFIFISPDGKMEKWVGELPVEELANLVTKAFGIQPK
ncbi:MAG: thioredoxin family protein [Bacteroidales bacterium]